MPIIAAYPNSVASFTEKFDLVDIVFAAHINALQAEVVALETILGTVPQGTASTVKARIQTLEASIATLSGHFDSGGLIPQSGVNGLVAALAGKAVTGHHHVDADITDLISANVFHAVNADNATHATSATTATSATSATSAASATNAAHATNADSATNATHATSADSATNASAVPWTGVTSKPFSQAKFGQAFVTTNSSGQASFPHGMSPQPHMVVASHYTGGGAGGPILVVVRSIDSANINVTLWDVGVGPGSGANPWAAPYASVGVNLFWVSFV